MSKKVLIISTSPRKNGNSEILADAFTRGAKEAGNIVEKISLYNKTVGFCKGCLACQKTHRCIIRDDVNEIIKKMFLTDVIVFATPVYFYEMCGQMKTLLDRSNPLFPSNYMFRELYLLATAADTEETAMDGVIKGLQGWIDCFEKVRLAKTIFAGGVGAIGEIKGHAALKNAYDMGRKIC